MDVDEQRGDPFFPVPGKGAGDLVVAVDVPGKKGDRHQSKQEKMRNLSGPPSQPAVAEHQQTAHGDDTDARVARDADQTGDQPDQEQRSGGMILEITVAADHEQDRQDQEQRLRPDHRVHFQQARAADDKEQQGPFIPAGSPAEPVHHPAAEPDQPGEQQTVKHGTESWHALAHHENDPAEKHRVESRKIHHRRIRKVVDRTVIMNMLGRAQVHDGVGGDTDPPMPAKQLDEQEAGNGRRNGIVVPG